MATIRDVAAKDGVSVTTVSRVLNNRGYISLEMREKIQDAIDALNYRPSEVARSLSSKRTNIIGVLLPTLNNSYYPAIASELSRILTEKGYKMMLYVASNIDDMAPEYISMLRANRVDGIIVALRNKAVGKELTAGMPMVSLSRFRGNTHPTILSSSLTPSLTSIRQPIAEMCQAAVECLLRQISGERMRAEEIILPVTLDRRESTLPHRD